MISLPPLTLLLCNFGAIGLLPILFFRDDGRYNLRWLATAAPFFVAPASLLLARLNLVEPLALVPKAAGVLLDVAAVLLCVLSIGLIAMTVGTHRTPLALWHQENDAPARIVTWGPYAKIRHPFYSGFLLAFAAAVLAFPALPTIACLLYAIAALSITARGEERRLATSEFAAEYQRYVSVTGRFVPRIGW
jgi:protein-S-isoprenylcysteine O-methyltransferase Ste14